VPVGNVDPAKARELFIQHALVEGDYDSTAAFVTHNRELKEELSDWQAKLRQTQIFAFGGNAVFDSSMNGSLRMSPMVRISTTGGNRPSRRIANSCF